MHAAGYPLSQFATGIGDARRGMSLQRYRYEIQPSKPHIYCYRVEGRLSLISEFSEICTVHFIDWSSVHANPKPRFKPFLHDCFTTLLSTARPRHDSCSGARGSALRIMLPIRLAFEFLIQRVKSRLHVSLIVAVSMTIHSNNRLSFTKCSDASANDTCSSGA